jgi:signal transduction histidine kinase
MVLALLFATSAAAQVPIPEHLPAGPAPASVQSTLYGEALEEGSTWESILAEAAAASVNGQEGHPPEGAPRSVEGLTVVTDALTRQYYALSFYVGADSVVTLYRHGAGDGAAITMLPGQFALLAEKALPVVRGERPNADLFDVGLGAGGVTLGIRKTYPAWAFVSALLLAFLAPAAAVYAAGLRRDRKRRGAEVRRLRDAIEWREAERKRLARELHDGPLQDVLLVKRMVVAARSAGADPESVELATSAITSAARGIRALGENLDPPALQYGLGSGLRKLTERLSLHYPDTEVELAYSESGPALPEETRLHTYRILQEALNNALKHGGASRVSLDVRVSARLIEARVDDDGIGFSKEPGGDAAASGGLAGGYGLKSARDRAASTGGDLTWTSGDGGTTVALTIPRVGEPAA